MLPAEGCVPLHAPLAVQLALVPVLDQESVAVSPASMSEGESVREIAGRGFTFSTALAVTLPPVPVHVSVNVLGPMEVGDSLSVPLVALASVQAPLAVQEVAFVEDHVSVEECPTVITFGFAAIEMTGGDGTVLSKR
jgi:hypothetical protein